MRRREAVGKRIGRFVLWCGMLFAMSAGIIAASRLSQDSLALAIGIAIGTVVGLVPVGVGLVVLTMWMRQRERPRRKEPEAVQGPQQPVIVVQVPPVGAYQPSLPGSSWDVGQRSFEVIGEATSPVVQVSRNGRE
jgi:hypothetical protein